MSHIKGSILETIGHTPMVKINRITKDSPHQFFAKIEYFNPGGSVKDRVAFALIEGAEKRGDLKPGGTIVEATSGNTGVGLALVAAVKGYKCIFIMPDKISEEKRAVLRAHGAQVVITPTGIPPEDPRSYISVSKRIAQETPNSFYANQFYNPDNPKQHYETTAPEIWNQTGGLIDAFVAGAGTGGTLSGVGKYLREKKPGVRIVGADPIGSILYDLFHHKKIIDPPAPYKIEGVGEDMLPDNIHLDVFTDFERVTDKEAFQMTRRLVAEEGICVGPSSAMALVGAIKFSQKLKEPSNIVILFTDNGRGYLSKAFNDDWMKENKFLSDAEIKNSYARVVNLDEYFKG
ncbi:MAG: cysteine synthase family protein [Bdellovibrionota bacterium]